MSSTRSAQRTAVSNYHRRTRMTAKQIDALDETLLSLDDLDMDEWNSISAYELDRLLKQTHGALDHGF